MADHKQGCDALGGYGHGVGPCTCGAVPEPAGADLDDAFDCARAALMAASDRASIRHVLDVLRTRVLAAHPPVVQQAPVQPAETYTAEQMDQIENAAFLRGRAVGAKYADWINATPHAQAEHPVVPDRANFSTAPKVLNTNDKAMWVTGWNECLDALAATTKGTTP